MRLVAAAIVRDGDLILIARRDSRQKMAGFWEFPGGKVEQDETIEECITREIQEELGVKAVPGRIVCESTFDYAHGSFKIVAIETVLAPGNFSLQTHDVVEWALPSELNKFNLLPGDIPIAAVLNKEHNEKLQRLLVG